MTAPAVCEHGRTAASCEACVHAAALRDPVRAAATRDELYPFPEGGTVSAGFLHEDAEAAAAATRSSGTATGRKGAARKK